MRPREDARVVRDHAVDAGGEHPLEVAVVVHRPGEHGRAARVCPVDAAGETTEW